MQFNCNCVEGRLGEAELMKFRKRADAKPRLFGRRPAGLDSGTEGENGGCQPVGPGSCPVPITARMQFFTQDFPSDPSTNLGACIDRRTANTPAAEIIRPLEDSVLDLTFICTRLIDLFPSQQSTEPLLQWTEGHLQRSIHLHPA